MLCSKSRKPCAAANEYKTFASLAYKKHAGNIEAGVKDPGYFLDNELSGRECKKAVVAYRGTDARHPKRIWSDFNIMLVRELEKNDTMFKNATIQFQPATDKYKKQRHTVDATGHLIGGALATHVTRSIPNKVRENSSSSRSFGFAEPFHNDPLKHGCTLITRSEGWA